jgi:hypothetical protein
MRIAFVGQKSYFFDASLEKSDHLVCSFFDHQNGISELVTIKSVLEFQPDVIIFFRPEVQGNLSRCLKNALNVLQVGYLTEPLVSGSSNRVNVDNLKERRDLFLAEIKKTAIDAWICYSNNTAEFASRKINPSFVMPLPVRDKVFADIKNVSGPFQPVFVGRLNEYRTSFLNQIKHDHNPIIIDHGIPITKINEFNSKILGINIHVGKMNNFEHRATMHLAMGHLLLSEILDPSFGILPNCEYIEFTTPASFKNAIQWISQNEELSNWIRLRGHNYSKRFKSSILWPRVIDSLTGVSLEKFEMHTSR